jgi:hypothetical protein
MRHLQSYRLFESAQTLTQEQKNFLNDYTQGSWSINPSTGLVDIKGDFRCSNCGLKDLQGIRFGVVTGFFSCNVNYLTSLEGAPQTVGGSFSCNVNKLTSLAGTPQIIKGGLNCNGNKLTSLEGAPQTIEGDFTCYDNKLTSLAGAPETVGGEFSSDDLGIPRGKWGIETFVDLLKTGTPKQKQLVDTLVDPKVLQQQIDENPERMLVKLKGVLKHPHFQGLKWPERLGGEKDLLSDLSDVGL